MPLFLCQCLAAEIDELLATSGQKNHRQISGISRSIFSVVVLLYFQHRGSTFTHLKKIFCVLKQHRFLGQERKLLLSWLECLVRLKRIKSLKINDGFESNRPCSVPQRIVRLDKCGFFPRLSSDTIDVL